MRTLLRLVLRLFPEDVNGIHRAEMEETVLDGMRSAPSRPAFLLREIWNLFRNGAAERVRPGRGSRRRPGASPGNDPGSSLPSPPHGDRRPLGTLTDDVTLAFRKLRKAPGFALAIVLTLGVGIGATVSMFSILEAALLRSLPYPHAEELALGRATFGGYTNSTCSFPDYVDHKEGTDAFESMAAGYSPQRYTLTGDGPPLRLSAYWVTDEFFRVLDVPQLLGRTFLPEDGEASSPFVTVISHRLWQDRFGGDGEIVGKTITVAGIPIEIIGVMPPGFRFMYDTDLWVPVRLGMFDTEGRDSHSWQVVGRLRDGVTLEEAQAQMDVVSAQLAEAYPESHDGKGMGFMPLGEALAEDYRASILLLMGATTLLLLIACGNVAGLLSAKATARRVEISVRSALGAGRGVLVRQLLVESLLLAAGAGALGCVLALLIQRATLAAVPMDLLGLDEIGLSTPMLLFTLAISLLTALVFGTGPALAASKTEPAQELRGSRTTTGGPAGGRTRSGMVVAQVALSVVLLVGSGLLIRSFIRLQSEEVGFPTENLLTATVAIGGPRYTEASQVTEFFRGVLEDVEALPGVRSASFTNKVPLRHLWTNWYIWPADDPVATPGDGLSTYSRTVMPGYFETLGLQFLRGRDHSLDDAEREVPYLIINESAAEGLFPGEDPLGRTISVFNGMGTNDYEVLGVVPDFRVISLDRSARPQMYFSHLASPSTTMHLMVRADGNPSTLVRPIRQVILNRDPDAPMEAVAPMKEVVHGTLAEPRILSLATGLFALTALLLSLTGLYAVLAFYVGRRTREIGIRIAFGATGGKVSGMVLRRGVGLVGIGLLLGMAGAAAAAHILQSQLYQVGALDSLTFASVALGFLGVGCLASLVPAWRATRIDPVRAIQRD